ncbi:hypothetical protein SAMN05444266_109353 [Chitinophaga jiangningensis]|uniref:Uncharacterized protein n=1 Tax=Chitinophaga jiangningensis TaxID=1419482 RepID=A0A1M7KIP4_9BACT|nr:hypothetical protein [Chitinophaga jiangningensis]SHM65274.1 hypothetical protein SAMN05444266_109353 [Chitinophaga jiangningensis]
MHRNLTDDPVLLSYAASTVPSPLEVSTGTATGGQIIISVEATTEVLCKMIVISVPVGADADEIFMTTPTPVATLNTSDWSTSQQTIKGKDISMPDDIDYAVFTLTNNTAGYAVNAFTCTISGNVNTLSGPATVLLEEYSSPVENPSFSTKQTNFTMTKSDAPAFYVNNFMAVFSATPTIPVATVENSTAFQLNWASNGTSYAIYVNGASTPVYSGTATTYTVTAGIAVDTTFILVATQAELTLYATLTVTVSNPLLTPAAVNTAGNESVGGTFTVTGAATLNGITASSLTISGSSTLADVTGTTATLNDATINGTLTTTGSATLGNSNINGTLNVTGNATLTGNISMVSGGVLLAAGSVIDTQSVYANTDGFAVAFAAAPSDSTKSCWTRGCLYTIGTWFSCMGGTMGSFGNNWSSVMNYNYGCVTLPIPKGSTWQFYGGNASGTQVQGPIYIFWFPLGNNNAEDTYRLLSAEEYAPVPPPPLPDFTTYMNERTDKATQFIRQLESAFGKDLDEATRSQLVNSWLGA